MPPTARGGRRMRRGPLEQQRLQPFGRSFGQGHSDSSADHILVGVRTGRATAAVHVGFAAFMHTYRKHSESGFLSAAFRCHEVCKGQPLAVSLSHHRHSDLFAVSLETDAVFFVCSCREEPGAKHYLEIFQCKFILGIPSQLDKFHCFRDSTAIFYAPDGIEHPPVEMRKHFRKRNLAHRYVCRNHRDIALKRETRCSLWRIVISRCFILYCGVFFLV